jgi:hypothetical protein
MDALGRHGPCPQHRFSYVNVASRARVHPDIDAVIDLVGQDVGVPSESELSTYTEVPA